MSDSHTKRFIQSPENKEVFHYLTKIGLKGDNVSDILNYAQEPSKTAKVIREIHAKTRGVVQNKIQILSDPNHEEHEIFVQPYFHFRKYIDAKPEFNKRGYFMYPKREIGLHKGDKFETERFFDSTVLNHEYELLGKLIHDENPVIRNKARRRLDRWSEDFDNTNRLYAKPLISKLIRDGFVNSLMGTNTMEKLENKRSIRYDNNYQARCPLFSWKSDVRRTGSFNNRSPIQDQVDKRWRLNNRQIWMAMYTTEQFHNKEAGRATTDPNIQYEKLKI
jgi:hypothetical protein